MSTKDLALRIVKDQFGILAEVMNSFISSFSGGLPFCVKPRTSQLSRNFKECKGGV